MAFIYTQLPYSHLKHFTAIPMQTMVTTTITNTGCHRFPAGSPSEADFISCIPCVRGNNLTIFCSIPGITSSGTVAPENISIGKYRTLAITLAIFVSFAIPPTIIPILKVETNVRSQLPINAGQLPRRSTPQKQAAAGKRRTIEARAYNT